MKSTGFCPKCSSTNVIADAQMIDRGDHSLLHELTVATFRNPGALIFKGQESTTVSAWVCGECGFIELYADSPKSIKIKSN